MFSMKILHHIVHIYLKKIDLTGVIVYNQAASIYSWDCSIDSEHDLGWRAEALKKKTIVTFTLICM